MFEYFTEKNQPIVYEPYGKTYYVTKAYYHWYIYGPFITVCILLIAGLIAFKYLPSESLPSLVQPDADAQKLEQIKEIVNN